MEEGRIERLKNRTPSEVTSVSPQPAHRSDARRCASSRRVASRRVGSTHVETELAVITAELDGRRERRGGHRERRRGDDRSLRASEITGRRSSSVGEFDANRRSRASIASRRARVRRAREAKFEDSSIADRQRASDARSTSPRRPRAFERRRIDPRDPHRGTRVRGRRIRRACEFATHLLEVFHGRAPPWWRRSSSRPWSWRRRERR